MKTWLVSGVLAVTLVGHTVHAKEDIKIGYIDMSRALRDVEDGKRALNKLKSDFEGKQKQLDKLQDELKAKKDEFEKRRAMMKPEVKKEKEAELQRKLIELQQQYVKLQTELRDLEVELTQDISRKLQTVIERVGDRDGYALIMNIGDTVVYYKRHLDVTDEIVREYNKQYKVK